MTPSPTFPTLRRWIGWQGFSTTQFRRLFQAWRDGKIRRKDLPEEVVAMALDLCERWRAEQERCRRVHAAQRLSRDHSPSRSRSRGAAATTLQLSRRAAALFFLVSGRSDQGEGTD